jgi:F-type H+-transporting ATPase subunit epsilon
MSYLQFELVSPEKLLVSKAVAMVTVPGGEGDYGVLPGHAPMITTVKPGVIDVYEQDGVAISERIFVAGGFAEVTGERCTVLAEEAVPVAELDAAKLDEQVRNLAEDLAGSLPEAERARMEMQLAIAKAKRDAVR